MALIELFSRLFTNQSSNILLNYKCVQGLNNSKNKLIIILLTISMLSILIITQQFSNALLDIYFNIKSMPIFNSFEEVCNNQEIFIRTTIFNTHLNGLDKVCNQELGKRSNFKIAKKWFNSLFNEEILLDVIQGKSVSNFPNDSLAIF